MSKKKSPVKIIVNVLLTLFLAFICGVIAVTVYSRITDKTVTSYSVLWVLTDSMEDTIPARSYILVKKVDPSEVKVDDIITFRSRDPAIRGNLNTHRVIKIIGDHEQFVTKGDNSKFGVDSTRVLPEDIKAVFVRNLPVLTFFGRVFTSTAGFAICIILMVAGTVLWFFSVFARKGGNKEDEFERLVQEEVARLEAQDKNGKNCVDYCDSTKEKDDRS